VFSAYGTRNDNHTPKKCGMISAEAEFTTKEKEMKERHEKELESLSSDAEGTAAEVKEIESTTAAPAAAAEEGENDDEMQNLTPKERKQLKARRKKERQREKELQRQAEIEEELKKAGPSRRDTEIQIMNELYLSPKKLMIQEIPADGHCLYRAVAFQCGGENVDYTSMRSKCADVLAANPTEYSPFAEFDNTKNITNYEDYVHHVRTSAEWGGHLELRALSNALKRNIVVYSAEAVPLRMECDDKEVVDDDILLSFHRHYYALGEHYNAVVPQKYS